MKTFKKLEIKSTYQKLIKLVEKIKQTNKSDFLIQNDKSDEYAKMIGKPSNEVATLKSTTLKSKPAYIWLIVDNDRLRVTNITPLETGQLTKEEYNKILDDFYDIIIKPNINSSFNLTITKDIMTINDYAGKEVAEKLNRWYELANKSTLNTHPNDFKRWAEFIISAHKLNSELNSSQLEQYLTEEKGMVDDELITKIIIDYEYGRDLLKEYDKHR